MRKFQIFFVGLLLSCLCVPSFAGEWLVTYQSEGIASQMEHPAPFDWYQNDVALDLGEYLVINLCSPSDLPTRNEHLMASGKIRAIMTWSGPEAPPANTAFQVRCENEVCWKTSTTTPVVTLTNDIGTQTGPYETNSAAGNLTYVSKGGFKYTHVTSGDGTTIILPWVNVGATVDVTNSNVNTRIDQVIISYRVAVSFPPINQGFNSPSTSSSAS